ncbi:unnamed protein product [Toxocara canis]|uniref:Structural maintenance of chromosomes protein 5 n=1 Tax=Toxocara canis TaxID=6265 RepID=A0A183UAY8_TOXCA|nr:unnamed protein product [Toxocara canis]
MYPDLFEDSVKRSAVDNEVIVMANLFQNGTPFADGSVTKIRFTNFLSMAEAELNFGPKLNLIIGPNGSGKSTVICGLCLALGGSPKLLGRSEVMSDYVRHGCEKGAVEVNIRDSKESHDRKVELIITKNNHVEYRRDGRKVTRAEVRSMAMSYGIQASDIQTFPLLKVDNPCVFLAQDKVKSFAQQTPELLLDNTEKACSNDLEKMHDKLRVFSKADCRKSSQKQWSVIVFMCEKEERSAARMEEAVKTSEEKLEEAREKLEEVEAEQERTSEEMERRNRQFLDLSDEYRSIYSELDGLAKADYISEAVRQANAKYHETMKNFEAWKEEMEKAEALLEEYRAKQADQSANSSLESEKVALKREYEKWLKKEDELDQKTNKINAGFSQLRIEKESIDRVDLSGRQQFAEKLEIVRATNPRQRCADAFAWYEAHKEQFRKPVYVPVLSMTMNYEDSAPYLETVIPSRDLMVFIFGCREDEQLLADSKHPWRISSTVVSDEQVAKLSVDQPLPESMRVLGFERTAFQLFTAPPVVKAFLNSVAHLSNIPIGTEKTKENLDEVCGVLKNTHRLFLAADLKVRLTKSLYRADISVQTDCLRRNLRYLTAHMPSHTGGDKLDEASVKQALCSIEQRSQKLRAELEEVKRVQQMVATQKEKVRCQLVNFLFIAIIFMKTFRECRSFSG